MLDQLKKAGLVDQKKAAKAQKAKANQARQKRKGQLQSDDAAEREKTLQAEQQARVERDRELNRQRDEAMQKKALAAQIRQIVDMNRVQFDTADEVFNFQDGQTVRQVAVDGRGRIHLANGVLAVVRDRQGFAVVPAAAADKIAERDASMVVVRNTRADDGLDEDDPYAEFQVPDDLMW